MFDPDIIPDKKKRLQKESFELFRRACILHEAVHNLDLQKIANEKMKLFYTAAIAGLSKDRDEMIEAAIKRYQEYKDES